MAFPAWALLLLLHLLPGAAAQDPPAPPDAGAAGDTGDDSGGDTGGDSGDDSGDDSGGDSGDDGEIGVPNDDGEAPPPDLENGIDLTKAREAPALTEAQHDFLKPKRSRLPQNPYAQTDFTAYTLEWGEFKIGVAAISAGVLPRTQFATVPLLWAFGVPNGSLKVNAVRLGPVDLALTGNLASLSLPEFDVRQGEVGLLASAIITDPWSVHVGAQYGALQIHGEPNLQRLSPAIAILGSTANETLDAYYETLQNTLDANKVELGLYARTISGSLATDIRFNRRDSLILQGTAVLARYADFGVTVNGTLDPNITPESLPVDPFGVKAFFADGTRPVTATGNVTASWQFAWKHFDLRLGLGYSAVPLAWVLQSIEFDYRFGGKTRGEERRIRKGWRKDKKHIDELDPASPPE